VLVCFTLLTHIDETYLAVQLSAVMILVRATPTATRDLHFMVISERPVILTSEYRALGEGAITNRRRFDAADTNGD
jgi:hypothetical protein